VWISRKRGVDEHLDYISHCWPALSPLARYVSLSAALM